MIRPRSAAAGALALAVVVTVAALVLRGAPSAAGRIASEDGNAAIEIPVGALEAGRRIDEIKISRGTDLASGRPPGKALATYRLLPDGLRFSRPARVTVTTPTDNDEAPPLLLSLSSQGGGVDILPSQRSLIDREAGTVVVSGDLGHFSVLLVEDMGALVRVRFADPTDHVVGEAFAFTAVIQPRSPEKGGGVFLKASQLFADVTTSAEPVLGPLTPKVIWDDPKEADLTKGEISVSHTFTCAQEGQVRLNLSVRVRGQGGPILRDAGGNTENLFIDEQEITGDFLWRTRPFTCKAKAAASTTPPSVASAKPRVVSSTASSKPLGGNYDSCQLTYSWTLADVRSSDTIIIHFTGVGSRPSSAADIQVGATIATNYKDGVFTWYGFGQNGGGEYTAEVILLGHGKPEGPTLARTSC